MEDPYFIFKGIKSTDMGIVIGEYTPIQHANKRTKEITIDGLDGSYTQDLGAYDTYTITLECAISTLSKNAKSINEVLTWLKGSGKLILSIDPDKCYEAKITNAIPIEDVIWVFNDFTLKFTVQPFRKAVNEFNNIIKTSAKNFILKNKGDYESKPIITIKGNGDITLTVNDEAFILQDVSEYVTINSEIYEVYKGAESANTLYKSENFPKFKTETNTISVSGNVTEIEINPNWRWF